MVTDTSLLSELSSVATVVYGRAGQTVHVAHVGTTFFGAVRLSFWIRLSSTHCTPEPRTIPRNTTRPFNLPVQYTLNRHAWFVWLSP